MADISQLVTASLFMAILGCGLAVVLAIASRRLYVYEDPRIDEVEAMLPHSNCGACGTPGCRPFAESLVAGSVDPGLCTVNKREMAERIADYLGVDVGEHERQVARLACAGGSHVAASRAHYSGLDSCRAAALVSGGGKGCSWGCLGLGDCADACDLNAIQLNGHGLPVVDPQRCTACSDCVAICPKELFSLHPLSHRLWITCRNHDPEDEAEAHCEVVCTACGRCSADTPAGLIELQDNLAVIDYRNNTLASPVAIERCPTGAIIWFDNDRLGNKGLQARKIIRQQPLPLESLQLRATDQALHG